MKLFRIKKRYEVRIMECNQVWLNDRMKEWQNDGWEIAGEVNTKIDDRGATQVYVYIPMKRIVKS